MPAVEGQTLSKRGEITLELRGGITITAPSRDVRLTAGDQAPGSLELDRKFQIGRFGRFGFEVPLWAVENFSVWREDP